VDGRSASSGIPNHLGIVSLSNELEPPESIGLAFTSYPSARLASTP
jgi:hypothetical protein